jgi:hypothetical protein
MTTNVSQDGEVVSYKKERPRWSVFRSLQQYAHFLMKSSLFDSVCIHVIYERATTDLSSSYVRTKTPRYDIGLSNRKSSAN